MDPMFERACGLDIHKETVVACILVRGSAKSQKKEVRTFAAHTRGLLELRGWLQDHAIQVVAMESTGVYWRPVYAILEEANGWSLIVGNAQHIKNVPGRKTDVKDAEWIARLAQSGLIRPSFVPPPSIRRVRDLVRSREQLVGERIRQRARVLKTLQLANIKLDGVASDVFGASGICMLHAMARGETNAAALAQLAKGQLRKKLDALEVALEGRLQEHHRRLLAIALRRLETTESDIQEVEAMITQNLSDHRAALERLMTIPGINRITATVLLAELGPDMSVFPTARHAASWAGVCPGNHQSAGIRKSGRPAPGNPQLKAALCQAAHAAGHKRDSYFRAKYYQLKARIGLGRAVVAIAHKLLMAAYHVLRDGKEYRELGPTYLDGLDKQRTVKRLVDRLRNLGVDVPLPAPTAS